MFGSRLRLALGAAILVVVGGMPVSAQELNWAQKMFDSLEHDFGVVAKGADVRHRFKIKNIYNETIRFQTARTSCMCASATLSKDSLASLEEGYLEISINTQQFSHEKSSTAIVTINSPQYMEVRIPIKVYIRTDVVLSPGAVAFGSVDKGAGAERMIDIAYAGRNDWKIMGVKTNNKFVAARTVERSRDNGRVNYQLYVTLDPKAPAGSVNDRISLETNDANSPYVPVLVTGQVEADIAVTPGVLAFGKMQVGESKTSNVVLKGKAPFVIEKIECDSDKQAFRFRPAEGEKRVHVIPLTLTAPTDAGKFTENFTVTIAGRPEPITFKATAEISPAPQ